MALYVIRAGDDGAVKVGVAVNVARRVAGLQTASAFPLKLIRAVRGGVQEEAAIHARLAQYRLQGEWFSPVGAVLEAGADLPPVCPFTDSPDPFLRCPLTVWREVNGMTCGDIAKRLGVEANAISRYERGRREPSLAVMHAIGVITGGAVMPNDWADWSVAVSDHGGPVAKGEVLGAEAVS